MLVDLARNDLSRHCTKVQVKSYKEAQYYSHVIHLVSKVSGKLNPEANLFDVVGDTFPCRHPFWRAKTHGLNPYRPLRRLSTLLLFRCYRFMGFNGDFNHAIMIRSFLSKQNVLHYQAGAGIVLDSDPEKELQEVNNKISALRRALELAETL